MSFINVGARPVAGEPIKTKKALRERLAQNPASVTFYGTSPFTPFNGTVADIPQGTVLVVCGPDPYTSRRWFANVKIQDGKIKVS